MTENKERSRSFRKTQQNHEILESYSSDHDAWVGANLHNISNSTLTIYGFAPLCIVSELTIQNNSLDSHLVYWTSSDARHCLHFKFRLPHYVQGEKATQNPSTVVH